MATGTPSVSAPVIPFTGWNRLESRPRQQQFDQVLEARIYDPLWMLGRQWQMGEFTGKDAGSGILAKVQLDYMQISGIAKYTQPPVAYTQDDLPMEPIVESINYSFSIKERVLLAKKWYFFLKKDVAPSLVNTYISLFDSSPATLEIDTTPPIATSSDLDTLNGAQIFSNTNLVNFLAAISISGITLDGAILYSILNDPAWNTNLGSLFGTSLPAGSGTDLLTAVSDFVAWVKSTYTLPDVSQENWYPDDLEYKFDAYWPVDTSNQLKLTAQNYHQGHFDWSAFEQDINTFPIASSAAKVTKAIQLMVGQTGFPGMPCSRWWEFENGAVNFCNLDGNPTDMAKIIMTQFALLYQDDWFVLPYTVPVGSYAEVLGIVVTDVFGVNTFVANYPVNNYSYTTGFSEDNDWKSWRWLDISKADTLSSNADPINTHSPAGSFPLLPVVNNIQESDPIESVLFIRDEVSDMVWGIEKIVPDNLGKGWDGYQRSKLYGDYLMQLRGSLPESPNPPDPNAKISFELISTTIPENWIPFIPIHLPLTNRYTHFQRGAMPRILDKYANSLIRPVTSILNYGLTGTTYTPYYIHEEKIPRAGAILETYFKRTRWYNGQTVLWVGRKKITGRGEGASGLTYDKVIDI
ncbi:MAG: hypothetical protein P4L41_06090 [Flavipsychrobacter sp.]|nr:hypothetical protein [Flavipsychrobacter sp.]